jgi:hypothetical protein
MPDFDTRPTEVNIEHYAGDTLSIWVGVATEVVAGRQWNAQVRSSRTSQKIEATMLVAPEALGAWLTLAAADCKRLAQRGIWSGFWDVQLSDAGSDPVTTLATGDLKIHPDVTRLDT